MNGGVSEGEQGTGASKDCAICFLEVDTTAPSGSGPWNAPNYMVTPCHHVLFGLIDCRYSMQIALKSGWRSNWSALYVGLNCRQFEQGSVMFDIQSSGYWETPTVD